jgi:hypothetical protein
MKLMPQLVARLRSRSQAQPSVPAASTARVSTPAPRCDWPPEAERRLTYQLLNHWEESRGTRRYPRIDDIDGSKIPELWPWCFILDTKRNYPSPYFQYLGEDLAKYSGIYLSGKDDWRMTLLDKAAAHLDRTLEAREPILIEDELVRYDGRQLLFRSIMLPLSDDGETISQVLGAANGRLKND